MNSSARAIEASTYSGPSTSRRTGMRTAASQILRTRSAKPMAVLLLIGRRAARDFAADDPVFVGVTRHRPLHVGIERLLVAPLLDQKDVLVVVFRQHQVELQTAVIAARTLRMPAHQVDELATVLRLRFELDDDHDLAHRRSFLDDFGHRCAIRHVKASARSENCGRLNFVVPLPTRGGTGLLLIIAANLLKK